MLFACQRMNFDKLGHASQLRSLRSNSKLACESRPISDVSQVQTEFSTIMVSDFVARKRAQDTFQTIVQHHADQMSNMDLLRTAVT